VIAAVFVPPPPVWLSEGTKPMMAKLIGSDTCSAAGITVRGHAPVLTLCRKLVDAGYNPATRLECYRGDALALTVRSIGEAAKLVVDEKGLNMEAVPSRRRCRRPCVENKIR
jgi:hypothetical protein